MGENRRFRFVSVWEKRDFQGPYIAARKLYWRKKALDIFKLTLASFSAFAGGYGINHACMSIIEKLLNFPTHLHYLTIYSLSVVLVFLYVFHVLFHGNQTEMRKICLFSFMNIFSIVYYVLVKTYFAP